jgi:integration host factor subunit beta
VVKSELLFAINEKLPDLLLGDVELALNCILNQMINTLGQGERIEIRGFGRFELRHRPSRMARNPKTGETVSCPAKVGIHFKPGKEMRARVDTAPNRSRITN